MNRKDVIMILRKPYAFFIKIFKQIHIVMLAKPSIYCTICLGLCVRDVLVSERDSH